MGRRVLHQCRMEQTVHCLSPCNYTEPAEHTESVMQREFSATNKLRTNKNIVDFYCAKRNMSVGDPGIIRTCDLRFRKPSLYPAELRDRMP